MNNNPKYTVFAGINGAGKSTLYENIKIKDLGVRINPDEIAKELGDFNNPSIQIKAGKIAIVKIKECIDKKLSFNQETTLTGKGILRQILKLKENGYSIDLYYVGVKNKELANERVMKRVLEGGHSIPKETIYKRYQESINNLSNVMKLADKIKIIDNSDILNKTLFQSEGDRIIYKAHDIPEWFKNPLEKYLQENIKEKIVKQYMNDFQGVKYLSADSAKIINDLNESKGKIHTIKEIKQLYNQIGKKIEGTYTKEDLLEFKDLENVINDLKKSKLELKQEQVNEKVIVKNVSKHMELDL